MGNKQTPVKFAKSAHDGILTRLWSALIGWFQPRATDADEAFRERCLRWIVPVSILYTTSLLISDITALGFGLAPIFLLYLMAYLAYLITVVLVTSGQVNRAGYVFATLVLMLFALDSSLIYWSPTTLLQAAVLLLMFPLFLPRNSYLLLFASLIWLALAYHTAATSVPSPLPEYDLYASAEGAFFASSIGLLAGGGMVYILLRQYVRQRDQLRDAVELLEVRVEERTRDLVIAKERAEQADSIKSQFLASMSHELRTPLNAILAFNELVAMGTLGPVTEEQVDYLQKSLQSGRHLLSLINDVLDITKIQAGMMKLFIENDFNVAQEVTQIAASTEKLLQDKPVRLITDIDQDCPPLTCDKRRIRQVLLNLMSNAIKFTEGGTITLSAKRRKGEVLFAVLDTGPGIPEDQHAIIFEPFVQTETGVQHAGGTGLGLPISKKLIEAHGGHLWLESTPGQGAAFFAALPVESGLELGEKEV